MRPPLPANGNLGIENPARYSILNPRTIEDRGIEGTFRIGVDGKILWVNLAMARILGYTSPDDLIECYNNRKYLLFVDPAERTALASTIVRRRKVGAFECRLYSSKGSLVWVRGSARPVLGPHRRSIFIEGVVSDITEQKQVEIALRESEERFRILASHAPVGIFQEDRNGIRTYVNERWCHITGASLQTAMGWGWLRFVHPDDRELVESEWRAALESGNSYSAEYRILRTDGHVASVQTSVVPVRDETRTITGYVGTLTDLTELKKTEEQLRQQNIELENRNSQIEAANRLKSQFLANMSHELRTPLNGIIGFAELMQDGTGGPVSPDQQEFLSDILTSARHLLQLINDILDLSKIEAGKTEFHPEATDLGRLVEEVCETLRPMAAGKRLGISVEIEKVVRQVFLDPAKLKQVLYNYMSNAVKFTPEEGRIHVGIRPHGSHAFQIEVSDTGIGIDASQIPRLFTEFEQLDGSASKKHQGTGLGLALTKRIVEAQGGRVSVRSTVGKGSTFGAVLPRRVEVGKQVRELDIDPHGNMAIRPA
jgi:PAS domain S-box-containing protein